MDDILSIDDTEDETGLWWLVYGGDVVTLVDVAFIVTNGFSGNEESELPSFSKSGSYCVAIGLKKLWRDFSPPALKSGEST